MSEPVIAIVAAREPSERPHLEHRGGLQSTIALLCSVLERGGRVLLAGESPHVVPLLMAAAEYVEPRLVETSEMSPLPPVILGPLVAADSDEGKLLSWRPETEEGGADEPSLLEVLSSTGLIDLGGRDEEREGRTAQGFRSILERHVPLAIFAVGDVSRTAELLDAAEIYRTSRGDRPPDLLWLLPDDTGGNSRPQWNRLGAWDREADMPPPKLDGQVVGGESGGDWDEELAVLARRAAAEASLTLTIDRAVDDVFDARRELR